MEGLENAGLTGPWDRPPPEKVEVHTFWKNDNFHKFTQDPKAIR